MLNNTSSVPKIPGSKAECHQLLLLLLLRALDDVNYVVKMYYYFSDYSTVNLIKQCQIHFKIGALQPY